MIWLCFIPGVRKNNNLSLHFIDLLDCYFIKVVFAIFVLFQLVYLHHHINIWASLAFKKWCYFTIVSFNVLLVQLYNCTYCASYAPPFLSPTPPDDQCVLSAPWTHWDGAPQYSLLLLRWPLKGWECCRYLWKGESVVGWSVFAVL